VSAVEVCPLFDLPTGPAAGSVVGLPPDAVGARLRDPAPANAAVAGGLGWLVTVFRPDPPPACVVCGTIHVYRKPAGFVLACPVCYPSEVVA
jgi:hypothetical protein